MQTSPNLNRKISQFAACVASVGTLAIVLWWLKPEADQLDLNVLHLDSPTCLIRLPNGELWTQENFNSGSSPLIPKGTQITGGCFKALEKQQ